ncbi:MAG: 50S ribosomal protein L10 [Bacilli bacterium]|nr:50S ribosomal protein L10 [Bacilli bacterium]
MANVKILEAKQGIIDEVSDKIKNSKSFVAFNYHGLSVADTNELRRILKESGSEFKVYKNTLVTRALNASKIDLGQILEGPKAFAFGTDEIAPIKALADFAKDHKTLTLEVGIVDGEVVDAAKLKELATIPSKEGLLTMFAGGLMEHVRNMAICLDLHSQNLEK